MHAMSAVTQARHVLHTENVHALLGDSTMEHSVSVSCPDPSATFDPLADLPIPSFDYFIMNTELLALALKTFHARSGVAPSSSQPYLLAFGEILDLTRSWDEYAFNPKRPAQLQLRFGAKPARSSKQIFVETSCAIVRGMAQQLGCVGI